ncbi:MAG: hypothetical protein JSV56_06455, partial [Methanomassiliicoccales archaeon]
LLFFEERIRVNGIPIPKDKVCTMTTRIKPIAENMTMSKKFDHPTFFEIITAMAFTHFIEENVDYAVLEVGLGGRLDATNVITPMACAITTVALDHTHVLGENLDDVAREKAGIIKPGVPVVTGVEDDGLLDLIKKICLEKNCEVYTTKEHGAYYLKESGLKGQIFDIESNGSRFSDLKIHLLGEHQVKNALIAAMTVNLLKKKGVDLPDESIKKGFENTRWPGRLEIVQEKPTIVLDCAHNPAGMKALKSAFMDLFKEKEKTFIIGIMRDKDIPGIVKEIAYIADNIIVTKPKFERASEPEKIENEALKYCDHVLIKENVAEAVKYAKKSVKEDDVICITGSIFNVGEAMQVLGRNEPLYF